MADEQTEWFTTWGGRVLGIIGIAVVAVIALLGATGLGGDYHPAAYAVCGLVAVGIWATMVRPAVGVREEALVLRNPLSTVTIPLAAVQQVAVGQYLAVLAGGRRLTNTGLGRGRVAARRDDALPETSAQRSYGGLIEIRIRHLAEHARSRRGIAERSEEQEALAADVRRDWAWPEIGLLVAFAVVAAVSLAL